MSDDAIRIHGKYIKWRQELGTEYDDTLTDFRNEHISLYKVTNVPKYRSFQYRLMQRSLVTNMDLERWNMVESNLCTFCAQTEETVLHLMWYCSQVQELWQEIFKYISNRYKGEILAVRVTNIIFNSIVQKKCHAINFICLITKQYIYRQKCQKNMLQPVELIRQIKNLESIEKYIAVKNNRLSTHRKKWGAGE